MNDQDKVDSANSAQIEKAKEISMEVMKMGTKQTITPGPWNVVGDQYQYFGIFVVQESTSDGICQIDSTPGFGDANELNARLIAAAPDMKAALDALMAGFVDGSIQFAKGHHHPANVLLCAAIEKAEIR